MEHTWYARDGEFNLASAPFEFSTVDESAVLHKCAKVI